MAMIESYRSFWVKSFAFGGHTKRSDFWLFMAGNTIVLLFLFFLAYFIAILFGHSSARGELALLTVLIYNIAASVPGISIQVRRLRDAGFNPWLILINLVPWVGPIVILAMCLQPSKVASPE